MEHTPIQVLDEDKTLSQCIIWRLIEEYYSTVGPSAWDETPYFSTSNTFIGETYAELIVAFLRDALPQIDPEHPVYIVELGAGTGTFSFFCVKALLEKLRYFSGLRDLTVRYVITDFAEATVARWESEPAFDPYREMLDYAVYWPELHDTITLRRSGVTIDARTNRNPVVCVANYFFDSIRHDYFQTDNGLLQEARLIVYRELDGTIDPKSPPDMQTLRLRDRFVTVSTNYYPDPELSRLLEWYRKNLDQGSVVFPISAFRCLRNLRKLSGDRLLLVSSDKGFHLTDYMQGHMETPYTPHPGSFAYMVNFHALAMYFRNLGGQAWHAQEYPSLNTMVAVLPDTGTLDNLNYVASTLLRTANPIKNAYQFLPLTRHWEPKPDCSDLDRMKIAIACVQFAHYDPWVFEQWGEHLCAGMNELEYGVVPILREMLAAVERNLYRTAYGCYAAWGYIRRLHFLIGDQEGCLATNEKIVAQYGPERDAYFYPAAIAENQGDYATALTNYRQALECDPESEHAREGVERMEIAIR